MAKHISIVIDWFGPYTKEEARSKARSDYGSGLYMLRGKVKYQKSPSELKYIGIAQELCSRIGNGHHIIPELEQECVIWLGEVASFGIPGKKKKVTDIQLDLAEWLHAYFLQLPLNTKKKINPPDLPATVLNRWWLKDYETPRKQRPYKDWPDVIDFLGREYGAKVVWFGIKLERWNIGDF